MPTVSVIVPNYNHARYLRRRIDSILAQTYQDFELILLDDCSTDESQKILESYAASPRVKIEFNPKNSGITYKQWNKGVRMARGRYIWIAESDDYADSRFLATMVTALEEHPGVTFSYCRSWTVGEDDQRLGYADWYVERLDANHWTNDFVVDGLEECLRFFVLSSPVPNASAVLFRKDTYERVGGAGYGLRLCGDFKLWGAMALAGKIAYFAEPLNYYRSHRENVRTRTQAGALDVAEYFYVMLWILARVAPPGTLPEGSLIEEILSVLPVTLDPLERIQSAERSLSVVKNWNLGHNVHVSREILREYFSDWEFALVGRKFAISSPSRWRFFVHRYRFFWSYFRGMSWRLRFVNLMRVLGAPLVGYRNRHWPEQIYSRLVKHLDAS